jgi:hypothetical protein
MEAFKKFHCSQEITVEQYTEPHLYRDTIQHANYEGAGSRVRGPYSHILHPWPRLGACELVALRPCSTHLR